MPSPQLNVETISFHGHEPAALPLLVGNISIDAPEWTRTGTRLPVAFVAPSAGRISIAVSFSCPELAGQSVTVRAVRVGGAGSAVQHVEPERITFDAGGHTGHVSFSAILARGGIDLDRVRWQWRFDHGGATHDATVSEHDIAVVLAPPQPPWATSTPAPADLTVPRWDVLRLACDESRNARTLAESAAAITKAVFEKWGGTFYHWQDGAETFASDSGDDPKAFDCDRFMALLGAAPPAVREIVDCSDVATIVSTFAAILGCPVGQLTLFRELRCNILKKVGHASWETGVGFPLHEIAVTVPLGLNPQIWDGCVMLSADAPIGTGDPTIALLPAGIDAAAYLKCLLSSNGLSFEQHILRQPLTRPIRPLSNELVPTAWDEHLEALADRLGFHEWLPDLPRVVQTFEPQAVAGPDWRVDVETAFPSAGLAGLPFGTLEQPRPKGDNVARVVCQWPDDPSRRVRITLYRCSDADAARRRFLYLLGRVTAPLTPLNGGPGIVLRSDDRKTIVGVTMNVAYKIIDAGERPVAETPDASRLIEVLTKVLDAASEPL